ncbi:MAG: type 4a pilus biogenesis protein PilO [Nitrospirota bacterium]
MALKLNIKFNLNAINKLPPYAKIIISFVPAIIIAVLVIILLILPKNREIKELRAKILTQEQEIAKSQSKVEKLSELTSQNEKLKKRLNELKEQLPEEKEVSGFLKQVSDLAIKSGLKILLWRPEQKKMHPSGIVYEIPVKVELRGSYHSLGYFFSSLTSLSRIVNLSDIRLGEPKLERDNVMLKVLFTATTFSAIPEEEIKKPETKKAKK